MAKGLRIDDEENLRILPEGTERSSKELSVKARLILSGKQIITNLGLVSKWDTNFKHILIFRIDLNQLKERLNGTVKLLQELDEISTNTRILNLAVRITKQTRS